MTIITVLFTFIIFSMAPIFAMNTFDVINISLFFARINLNIALILHRRRFDNHPNYRNFFVPPTVLLPFVFMIFIDFPPREQQYPPLLPRNQGGREGGGGGN